MAVTARIDELRRKYEENPRRYFAPLANEYRKAGDLDSAIAICRRELAAYPEHISGHIVLGQALYESGRRGDARAVFEAALGLDPENLIALRHLGDIARAEGDDAGARRWYGRILEADPRNDDIAALLATVAAERFAPPQGAPMHGGFADVLGEARRVTTAAPEAATPAPAPVADEGFVDGWDLPAFEAAGSGAATEPAASEGPSIPVVSGPISENPRPPVLPHLAPDDEGFLDDLVEDFRPPGAAQQAAPAEQPAEQPTEEPAPEAASPEAASPEAQGVTTAEAPAVEEADDEPAPWEAPPAPEGAAEARAVEIPDWLEATPATTEHAQLLDAELDPVVGLDVPPVVDSAQVQLGAADLGGAELPAAELWAAELAAAEPQIEDVLVGDTPAESEPPAAEPVGDGTAPDETAPAETAPAEGATGETVAAEPATDEPPVGELPQPEPADALDLEPALIEAAPPVAASEPAPHDDARVDADELSALASGAFATETLAELFVQQGHLGQAVAVYERLAAERPDDAALQRRLDAVRRMAAGEPPEAEPEPEPEPQDELRAEPQAELVAASEREPVAEPESEPIASIAEPAPATATRPAPSAGDYFATLASRTLAFAPTVERARAAAAPHPHPAPEPTGPPAPTPVAATDWLVGGPASEADERAARRLADAYGRENGAATSIVDDLAAITPAPPPPPAAAAEPSGDDLSFDRFFAGFEDLLDTRSGAHPEPATGGGGAARRGPGARRRAAPGDRARRHGARAPGRVGGRRPGAVQRLAQGARRPVRVAVLNGPNLNLLGRREPHIYGRETLADVEAGLSGVGRELGVEVRCLQRNGEGELIDVIHALAGEVDGVLINAGAYTHTSLAIRDALVGVGLPYVEVHVSNVHAREPERHHSMLAAKALAVLCGFGVYGYELGLRGLVRALRARAAATAPVDAASA